MKTIHPFNNLRRYRKASGLTQTQVARILGLHDHNRLSNWECGKCFPTVTTLFRLAAIYQTVPDAFYPDVQKSIQEEIRQRKAEILKTAEALQKKQRGEANRLDENPPSTDRWEKV